MGHQIRHEFTDKRPAAPKVIRVAVGNGYRVAPLGGTRLCASPLSAFQLAGPGRPDREGAAGSSSRSRQLRAASWQSHIGSCSRRTSGASSCLLRRRHLLLRVRA